jgi:uncharacterized RDD family membrane protein YckC
VSDDAGGAGSARRVPALEDFPETGTNALASFGQRAWGRTLDTFLTLGFVSILLQAAPVDVADPEQTTAALIWFLALWVLTAGVYETVAVAMTGLTVGKIAFGTRVARFVDGGRPTWEQSLLRCLLPLAGATSLGAFGLPVIGAGTVYLSSLSDPFGRGWHDQAGGTVVIRTR